MSLLGPPDGYALLTPEQKARAAAIAIAFRYTRENWDIIPFAIFILDGAEGFEQTMLAQKVRDAMPDPEPIEGMVSLFVDTGCYTVFNGQAE